MNEAAPRSRRAPSADAFLMRRLCRAVMLVSWLRRVLSLGARVLRRAGVSLPPWWEQRRLSYAEWVGCHGTLTEADRTAIRTHIAQLRQAPLLSVAIAAAETPPEVLRDAVTAVCAQLYPHWELRTACGPATPGAIRAELERLAAMDARICIVDGPEAAEEAGVAGAGEFVVLPGRGGVLAEEALYEIAAVLEMHPETDILYSDEDRLDADGRRCNPCFKPEWDPELMLGQAMLGHLVAYRRTLLARIGTLPKELRGASGHALALRAARATVPARIRHIAAVLCHSHTVEQDADTEAARRAVEEHLRETGAAAEVLPAPGLPGCTRVRWRLPEQAPRVSIVVPTRDRPELLSRCIEGLLHRTDYPDLEVVVVDNDSHDPVALELLRRLAEDARIRVLPYPGPFNYSSINNTAARVASGRILLLLNNDVEVIEPDWLREMASQAMRPEVGAVGAKLLFADNTVQHAGVMLGYGSFQGGPGVAGHLGLFMPRDAPGPCRQFLLVREVGAVTAACLALRREVFEAVGGLDEVHLPVQFNDVDLCLRIRERGLNVVWTPFAELHHLESASRGRDQTPKQMLRADREARYMRKRWGPLLDSDPYYNPAYDTIDHTLRLADPPRRARSWAAFLR